MTGRFQAVLAAAALLAAPAAAQTAAAPAERLAWEAEQRYLDGDPGGAAELYRQLAERGGTRAERAGHLVTAAWLVHLGGDRERATEGLLEAFAVDPELPLDPRLYDERFLDLAASARRMARARRQRLAHEAVERAGRSLERGDLGAARADLETGLALVPRHPVALYNLALIDLRQGDLVAAGGRFEQAREALPPDTDAELEAKILRGLGTAHYRRGRWPEAAAALEASLAAEPSDAETRALLARARAKLEGPAAGSAAGPAAAEPAPPGPPEAPVEVAAPAVEEAEPVEPPSPPSRPAVAERKPGPGAAASRKPVKRKQLGLEFAGLDYGKLGLRGALIKKVAKRSPAARAGLRKGDLVLKLGEVPVLDPKDFSRQLRHRRRGGPIVLEVLRDGAASRVELDLEGG